MRDWDPEDIWGVSWNAIKSPRRRSGRRFFEGTLFWHLTLVDSFKLLRALCAASKATVGRVRFREENELFEGFSNSVKPLSRRRMGTTLTAPLYKWCLGQKVHSVQRSLREAFMYTCLCYYMHSLLLIYSVYIHSVLPIRFRFILGGCFELFSCFCVHPLTRGICFPI